MITKNLRGDRRRYYVTKLVFVDSVLCLGSMRDETIEAWKSKIFWYLETNHFKDMNRIDCMPTELEWKIFTGITTVGLTEKIQSLMRDLQCEPEQFKDRIIFMSMYNDTVRRERGSTEKCETNSVTDANCAPRFPFGRWSFWGLDQRRNGAELILINQMEIGTRLLNE